MDQEIESFVPQDEDGPPAADQVTVEVENDAPLRGADNEFGDRQRKKNRLPQRLESAFTKLRDKDAELQQERAARRAAEEQLHQLQTNGSEFIAKAHGDEAARARADLKAALANGDTDAAADATERLTDAKAKQREVEQYRQNVQRPAAQAPTVQPDGMTTETREWLARSPWFNTDPELTETSLVADKAAIRKGFRPGTQEYFDHIDAVMRKHHPEAFEDGDDDGGGTPAPQPQRRQQAVAPVSSPRTARQAGSTTKVVLTPAQRAQADASGHSYEAYARELVKLRQAGKLS